MYPFSSRLGWLLASRYKHITRAFERNPPSDTLVQERLESMARWGRIRAIVAAFLYLGLAASAVSLAAQYLPALQEGLGLLRQAAAFTGAFTGLLTVGFLFCTRLLSQIEADVLTLSLAKR